MWLAQENGKLQLKNIASRMFPEYCFTSEAYGLYALNVIVHVLKSMYLHDLHLRFPEIFQHF